MDSCQNSYLQIEPRLAANVDIIGDHLVGGGLPVMQVDIEMYLAASPPLFSPLSSMGPLDVTTAGGRSSISNRRSFGSYRCSSNTHDRHLSHLDFDFGNMTLSPALIRSAAAAAEQTSNLLGRRINGYSNSNRRPFQLQQQQVAPVSNGLPLRSCLVIRPEEENNSTSPTSEPSSPGFGDSELNGSNRLNNKKRVVFADAKGLSLTQVKMMTEPSDCPPRWTAEFLEQVTGGASADVRTADRWELQFAQPASDYLEFRARLDSQNVSLENVVVSDEPAGGQQLVGTIKVKNLSFSKRVTVRISYDNWANQTDVDAVFASPSQLQGGAGPTAAINLFDTFSFKISIPPVVPANRIQFCLRFSSDAGEYWDNNIGKNYVIVKPIETSLPKINSINSSSTPVRSMRSNTVKYPDLLSPGSKVDLWADFASWNHLVNDSPYW